ncbi:MAG: hypothetical protein P4L33_21270 [Capsulimonadaceae bacterium]|nr:hypothetical protein [Capsulimonadaceae bacterium]
MKLVFAALLLVLSSSITLCAQDSPAAVMPLTRVTLYTSGVGYFERAGIVDGDAALTLGFPVDQVNDVLKSLILLDRDGGTIRPVTYAAIDPVAKQLKAFSIDVSDNPDRAELLNRIRGTHATVTAHGPQGAPDAVVSGVVIGVESRDVVLPGPQGGKTRASLLNMLADDGIRTIALDDIVSVRIDDAKLDRELREALTIVSQGRDDSRRSLTLNFEGKGRRHVLVGYVAATPVWQTSYRLLLGKKPLLQGWGIVQNTTQEDWDNVSLTLVSGQPVSFIEDLYTPLYLNRPIVRSQIAEALAPVAHEADELERSVSVTGEMFGGGGGNGIGVNRKAAAAMPTGAMARFAAPSAPISADRDAASLLNQSTVARGARLGEALFSYGIPVGVTVPRQQSAMIPFLASSVEVQKVGIYNQSVNALHPMSGARFKNTTGMHLLGGPITVFEEGSGASYAGDAIIDDTQPGQSRLISYALDVPVSVTVSEGNGNGRYLGFRIVKGTLETMSRTDQSTLYKIKNNGELEQTIVVEQPKLDDGWKLVEPAKPSEETSALYRFDIAAPSGKATELTVRQSRVNWQSIAIASTDLDTLLVYAHDGAISDDVKGALQETVTRRKAVADADAKLSAITAQIDQIGTGQARIRDNMRVLSQSSTLYKRYADELDQQESKLADLGTKRDAQQAERDRLQAALDAYLSNLTVGVLPAG